jgi:hypothetical protein
VGRRPRSSGIRRGYQTLSYSSLLNILVPSSTFFYMEAPPQKDGWKNDYAYGFVSGGNVLASQVFGIVSGGNDGSVSGWPSDSYTVGPFTPTDYGQDIVWADGFFIRWPGST